MSDVTAVARAPREAAGVRAVTPADVPAIAALLARVDPRARDADDARARLLEVFFHNPWRDGALPSLMAEDAAGRVQGFLGVIPRPMRAGGRAVRAAVGVRLTVDPQCREFVGVRLLRRFIEGPQDLSLIDGGGCATRAVWERLGGAAPLPYSVSWTRPLRPAALVLRRLGRRFGPMAGAARTVGTVVDRALASSSHSPFRLSGRAAAGRDVDAAELVACFEDVLPAGRLRARWDPASLAWVLDRAHERVGGIIRRVVVPGRSGAVAGGYVLGVRPGETAQVVAMIHRAAEADTVLRDVIVRAREEGCLGVSGRADLRLVIDLTDRRCLLHATRTQTLVHSHDAELVRHVERGDAVLGRLDGEWWVPV